MNFQRDVRRRHPHCRRRFSQGLSGLSRAPINDVIIVCNFPVANRQLPNTTNEVCAEVRPGKSRQAGSKKLQEPKVIREVSSAEPVDLSGSLLPGKREDYSNSHPPAACFTRRH
ncbi:hypothetical protein PUN28_004878 [Cardiocondyla obscurior]|uniref:Uncharacterized protein n=1 Tax=Cardiocondyla obscurior TaxID=286306 RepID=A0AAW2GCX8_9HYME